MSRSLKDYQLIRCCFPLWILLCFLSMCSVCSASPLRFYHFSNFNILDSIPTDTLTDADSLVKPDSTLWLICGLSLSGNFFTDFAEDNIGFNWKFGGTYLNHIVYGMIYSSWSSPYEASPPIIESHNLYTLMYGYSYRDRIGFMSVAAGPCFLDYTRHGSLIKRGQYYGQDTYNVESGAAVGIAASADLYITPLAGLGCIGIGNMGRHPYQSRNFLWY